MKKKNKISQHAEKIQTTPENDASKKHENSFDNERPCNRLRAMNLMLCLFIYLFLIFSHFWLICCWFFLVLPFSIVIVLFFGQRYLKFCVNRMLYGVAVSEPKVYKPVYKQTLFRTKQITGNNKNNKTSSPKHKCCSVQRQKKHTQNNTSSKDKN